MIYVEYTFRINPEANWPAAQDYIRKGVDLMNRDDNGITDCTAIRPFDGPFRVVFVCQFETFEDSSTWLGKSSDEFNETAAWTDEGRKYLLPGAEVTHYWGV